MTLSHLIQKWAACPLTSKIIARVVPWRTPIIMGIHIILFAVSYFYSLFLINGMAINGIVLQIVAGTIGPLILIRLAVFHYHDLFCGLWRYVGFEDLVNIIRATVISTLLLYILGQVWERFYVPEQVYVLDTTFCIFLSGGIRVLVRKFRERYVIGGLPLKRKRIYLVGPVEKVQPLLKDLVGDPVCQYLPLAVVDPEKDRHPIVTRMCDVPIYNVQQSINRAVNSGGVDGIIICWPGGHRKQVDSLVDRLKVLNAEFKIIPHYEDILDDKVRISDIRKVEIEDLLERPPVNIDMAGIGDFLKDKTVLVTGGAGSIGSEICRQVAGFGPRRLVIVERSENSLYDFEREIVGAHPDLPIFAAISSINDRAGMEALMRAHRVDAVFHAAAYKHVPLMEKTPIESAYNNIIGTYNVVKAAIAAGARRFVMISTDKAVNPANVMGVTKRIAEMVVQSHHRPEGTWFMTVRFGNVLGSAGSVIPIFKRQIAQGRAVTVTHPDIERFFMTIPEAVQLVLQAGCMARGGEIFVLDMGRPVKILKLAEKLITLSGKRPYEDIDIIFSGLRPGEKMYEELFNDQEDLLPTSHPRIKAAVSLPVDHDRMEDQVAAIKFIIGAKDEKAIHRKFLELVPGYRRSAVDGGPVQASDPQPGPDSMEKAAGNRRTGPVAAKIHPTVA
jgi:FlaA1/EpsC-like NDP-sugar epimerase